MNNEPTRDTALLSVKSPLAAMVALGLALTALLVFGNRTSHFEVMMSAVLAVALAALTLIDIRQYRLPDQITLPLIGVGIVAAPSGALDRVAGAVVGFAVLYACATFYRRLRGIDGLGLGDASFSRQQVHG